jgi:hypothetical protein
VLRESDIEAEGRRLEALPGAGRFEALSDFSLWKVAATSGCGDWLNPRPALYPFGVMKRRRGKGRARENVEVRAFGKGCQYDGNNSKTARGSVCSSAEIA